MTPEERKQLEVASMDLFVRMMPSITGALKEDGRKRTDLSVLVSIMNGEVDVRVRSKQEQLDAMKRFMPGQVDQFKEASKKGTVVVLMVNGLLTFVFPIEEGEFDKVAMS